jgi:hypothetical protein
MHRVALGAHGEPPASPPLELPAAPEDPLLPPLEPELLPAPELEAVPLLEPVASRASASPCTTSSSPHRLAHAPRKLVARAAMQALCASAMGVTRRI